MQDPSQDNTSLHTQDLLKPELSWGTGAKGTLPPSSSLSAPGLEEETSFSCSAF